MGRRNRKTEGTVNTTHGATASWGAHVVKWPARTHLPRFSTILLKVSPVMTTYPAIAEGGRRQTHHHRVANVVCATKHAPKKGKRN